jgi:hypothetical protein
MANPIGASSFFLTFFTFYPSFGGMKVDYSKIQIGDDCQIANGDWHKVMGKSHAVMGGVGPALLFETETLKNGKKYEPVPLRFITEHRPKPKPPVYKWVDSADICRAMDVHSIDFAWDVDTMLKGMNWLLTNKYGKPPK